MIKRCYSEYVRWALRFYARHLNKPTFKHKVDELNWCACHNVIETYSRRDKDILAYVYGSFDTIGDNVYEMANKYHIHQDLIWNMMGDIERKVAIERGLWYEPK